MVSYHVLAILLPSPINPFPQKGMVLWKKINSWHYYGRDHVVYSSCDWNWEHVFTGYVQMHDSLNSLKI